MTALSLNFNEEDFYNFFYMFYGNVYIYIALGLLTISITCYLFYLDKRIVYKMKEIISPQKNDTYSCISIWILKASRWIPWLNLVYTIGSLVVLCRIYISYPDIGMFKKALA